MRWIRSPAFIWGVVGLTLFILAVLGIERYFSARPGGKEASRQEAARPRQSDDGRRLVLTGEVDLRHGITLLYPLQAGRVEEVMVSEGQHVEAGDELLRLNDELARALRDQAQADLRAAEAQLEEARQSPARLQSKIAQQEQAIKAVEARLGAARHQLAQARELSKNDLIPKDQLGAAEDQVRALEAMLQAEKEKRKEMDLVDPANTIAQAEALVAAKKGQLDQAEFALKETVLRAPAAGTVLRLNVRAGDVLSSQPREAAVLFAPDDDLVVRLDVEQEFAEQLQTGYPALVEDAVSSRGVRRGYVEFVAPVYLEKREVIPTRIPFTTDSRTLECVVGLSPGEPSFRIGQEVRVTVELGDTADNPSRHEPVSSFTSSKR